MRKCKHCNFENDDRDILCKNCGKKLKSKKRYGIFNFFLLILLLGLIFNIYNTVFIKGDITTVAKVTPVGKTEIQVDYIVKNIKYKKYYKNLIFAPRTEQIIKGKYKKNNTNRLYPIFRNRRIIFLNLNLIFLILALLLIEKNRIKSGKKSIFKDKLNKNIKIGISLFIFVIGNITIVIFPKIKESEDTFFLYSNYKKYNLAQKSMEQIKKGDIRDDQSKTALMFAAESGNINFVQLVLKYGAKVNQTDRLGKNVLNYAVKSNNFEIVKLLVSKGAKVIRKNNHVSLIDDLDNFSKETVELLIEAGISKKDVDQKGNNLLHKASKSGNIELINYLLSKGYDIEERNITRETPLWIAVKNKNKDVAENLINRGADIYKTNRKGESVFYNTVEVGEIEILKSILKKTDIKTLFNKNRGKNILSVAIKSKNYDILNFLLENGYKIEKREKLTILDTLLNSEKSNEKIIEISNILIDNNAEFSEEIAYKLIDISKGKLNNKIIKHYENTKEEKASFFDYCIRQNNIDFIKIIGEKFKDVINTKVNGDAPIHVAFNFANNEIQNYIMELGADKNILDNYNKTLLMYSIEKNNESLKDLLFKDLTAKNSFNEDMSGYTVLTYALKAKNTELANKIIDLRKNSGIKNDPTLDIVFAMYMNENEIADKLSKNKFDDKFEMSYVETPLIKAIKLKNLKAISLILGNSEKISLKDRNDKNTVRLFLENFRNGDTNISIEEKDTLAKLIQKIDTLEYKDAYDILFYYGEDLLSSVLKMVKTIDYKDKDGTTFLMSASMNGDLKLLKLLLQNNADISIKNNSNDNFVDLAVRYNENEIISYIWEYLLEKSVKSNNKDYLKIFNWICETDNLDLLKKSITENYNYNFKDSNGNTPLMIAVKNNGMNCTKELLKNKDAINIKNNNGETPLIIALKNGNLEISKLLLEKGADVNSIDNEDNSVLLSAFNVNDQDFIISLIEKGADITKVNSYGQNVLLKSIEKQDTKVINYLSQKNIDFNIKDFDGNSAVDYASKIDNPQILSEMLTKISNGNFKNNGNDILGYAIKKKDFDLVKKLIGKGAKPNVNYRSGKIGLIEAIKNNNIKIARKLIISGANIDIQSFYKEVPVIEAYRRNQYDLVNLMIEKGANVNVKDGRGVDLFSEAKRAKNYNDENTEVIKKLYNKGFRINKKEATYIIQNTESKEMFDFLINKKIFDLNDELFKVTASTGNIILMNYILEKDKKSELPILFYSSYEDKVEMYEKLISENPTLINKLYNGISILHVAVQTNNLTLIKYLFNNYGSTVNENITDTDGWTPLMYSFYKSYYVIADYLLSKGADISITAKHNKIIYSNTKKSSLDYHNCLDILVRTKNLDYYYRYKNYFNKEDFNSKDWNGKTILAKIIEDSKDKRKYKKKSKLILLLENGSDIYIKDNNGEDIKSLVATLKQNNWAKETFNTWYSNKKKQEFTAILSENNFNSLKAWIEKEDNLTYKDNNGKNILMYAIDNNNSKLVDYILNKKVNINYKDNYGDTALMYAVANNYYDIAEKLLINKANPNIKNRAGNKAIDIAKFRKMRNLLRKYGSN